MVYEKKWYIIHTYSGYEKKVATDLEKRIESLNLTDRVFRILVPEEEVLEEKRGKMVKVPRKLFPSYVMIEMLSVREENELGLGYRVDSDAWYVIRNTNGVTGFVGVGSDPIPLSDEEASDLLAKIGVEANENENRFNIDFKIGERVVVKKDSFYDQTGEISDIDYEHGRVTVMLEVFGRLTPVELEYNEVEKSEY
ncbi:MAG: transcription termination/antitermination factor NusG [Leptotrichia sp.]|nr:transcription termination/antitermination factor NusG [Leptotrichia sp.]MBF1335846.1 transcription termination/antitermination factor NusG [Leptotrichia sp.]